MRARTITRAPRDTAHEQATFVGGTAHE